MRPVPVPVVARDSTIVVELVLDAIVVPAGIFVPVMDSPASEAMKLAVADTYDVSVLDTPSVNTGESGIVRVLLAVGLAVMLMPTFLVIPLSVIG